MHYVEINMDEFPKTGKKMHELHNLTNSDNIKDRLISILIYSNGKREYRKLTHRNDKTHKQQVLDAVHSLRKSGDIAIGHEMGEKGRMRRYVYLIKAPAFLQDDPAITSTPIDTFMTDGTYEKFKAVASQMGLTTYAVMQRMIIEFISTYKKE